MEYDDDILEIWTEYGMTIQDNQVEVVDLTMTPPSPEPKSIKKLEIPREYEHLRLQYHEEFNQLQAELQSLEQELGHKRRDLDLEELYVDKVKRQPITSLEHEQTLRNLQERLVKKRSSFRAERIRHAQLQRRISIQNRSFFNDLPCLCGELQLRHVLGRGSTSEVWQAFCLPTISFVAVKLSTNLASAEQEYNNHKMIASNSSRYVVPIYSLLFTTVHDIPYAAITMEYMECDLAHFLETHRPCAPLLARHILQQIALALAYMHQNNIAHCDLKPANIMVADANGAVTLRLSDFHLSRSKTDPIIVGSMASPGYAPPEWHLLSSTHESHMAATTYEKFDVWGLGVIFFQCLFGRHPMGSFASKVELKQQMLNYTKLQDLVFPAPVADVDKAILLECLRPQWESRPTALQVLHLLSPKSLT
ncbi:hypothetical protein LEN26_015975 [Aphanomyces euteiches]|nr:hypothetical protein LEN26_015975 [Aphanomyces euteiches]KAH9115165.1 hypothetical protein AeMF1_010779 [Aphanomyces euteiches]KAH9195180.1 hypothetical protein AeNC1_002851 [Aphanomyces euteiches]